MPSSEKVKGLLFLLLWFIIGGAVSSVTVSLFLFWSIGGVFEPPAIWSLCRDLGLTVMPIVLTFGGVPAAVQIMRGRPWERAASISFAICVITWIVLWFVVDLGPSIWGWTW
jgi:hypothetical protein